MGTPYPLGQIGDNRGIPWFVAEPAPPPTGPKLLAQFHAAIRVRHLSPRTEEAYRHWIRRYLFFTTCAIPRRGANRRSTPS